MATTSTIQDFCKTHDIKYQPITLTLKKNKDKRIEKKFNPAQKLKDGTIYKPITNDFYGDTMISNEELLNRQQNANESFTHYGIDTTNVFQIDIDNLTQEDAIKLVEYLDCPYFLSTTKKLPHIFIKGDTPYPKKVMSFASVDGFANVEPSKNSGELLCGLWSFAPKDAIIYNANKELKLDFERLYKLFPSLITKPLNPQPNPTSHKDNEFEKVEFKTLKKVVNGLDRSSKMRTIPILERRAMGFVSSWIAK